MTLPHFPPSYSVRTSKRARRVNLRIRAGHGLEIILPQSMGLDVVPSVLQKFRPWIEKHYQRLCPESSSLEKDIPCAFFIRGGQEFIILPAFSRSLTQPLEGIAAKESTFVAQIKTGRYGATAPFCIADDSSGLQNNHVESLLIKYAAKALPPFTLERLIPHCRALSIPPSAHDVGALVWLRSWVKEEARRILGARLEALSEKHNFPYTRFTVRFQRTRWGSCSAKGGISLNATLLFLPDALQQYVILHELCHTKEMNHSEAFWRHLFRVDVKALSHDKAMRKGWQYVPAWAMRQPPRADSL